MYKTNLPESAVKLFGVTIDSFAIRFPEILKYGIVKMYFINVFYKCFLWIFRITSLQLILENFFKLKLIS